MYRVAQKYHYSFRLSPHLGICSFGMCYCITGSSVPNVSNQCSGLNFKIEGSKTLEGQTITCLKMWGKNT